MNVYLKQVNQEWNDKAKILKSLDHDRLSKLFELYKLPGKLLVCGEYLRAGSLKDELLKAPLSEEMARKYIRQVIEGLVYIHSKDIVHGDIRCM